MLNAIVTTALGDDQIHGYFAPPRRLRIILLCLVRQFRNLFSQLRYFAPETIKGLCLLTDQLFLLANYPKQSLPLLMSPLYGFSRLRYRALESACFIDPFYNGIFQIGDRFFGGVAIAKAALKVKGMSDVTAAVFLAHQVNDNRILKISHGLPPR
jgi:hypothetical protein